MALSLPRCNCHLRISCRSSCHPCCSPCLCEANESRWKRGSGEPQHRRTSRAAPLAAEIHHRRVWSSHETDVAEAILFDNIKRLLRQTLGGSEVEQPVEPVGYLPALTDLPHRHRGRIEGDGILVGHRALRRLMALREPVHHWLVISAGGATDEADEV